MSGRPRPFRRFCGWRDAHRTKSLAAVYYLLNRRRLQRELAEEIEAHHHMMSADRRPHFGNATRLREESREVWSWIWLGQLWQDLHYGARVLWGAPGFTLGAVAILAPGIGVNLAEFQIFDALIFHRLNIQDANSALQFSRFQAGIESRLSIGRRRVLPG